jgi:hypothetical protein
VPSRNRVTGGGGSGRTAHGYLYERLLGSRDQPDDLILIGPQPSKKYETNRMKKQSRRLDPAALPKMSEMLLTFARPLMDQLPAPPTTNQLQSAMTIASLIWNLPEYERAAHPKAAEYRKALDRVVADMPAEGREVIVAMATSEQPSTRAIRASLSPRLSPEPAEGRK